ncbi:AAA family ATPase [Streptomyces sp. H39-S7]|uniref:AAA family ATPase n=1 Tax=Streptomyces sp. H39-S7 TaxID=3004357 RepID=UPI0022AF6FA0|nr:AAA family ATPase [Streptomyces sp. H39-S7]MCZ4119023.1 AAA family ATPase [Streptomyces sp. H39-S7]
MGLKGAAGEPIPNPFNGLARHEVEFRRGEFSLIAAGPGTGKSLLALNLAMYGNLPCLYFSADSGAATQITRATAIITGENVRTIKRKLIAEDFGSYHAHLGKRWWVRFNFDARPTPRDLERDLACYFEVFGCFPHLIVVDNITNVDGGAVTDAEGFTFGLEAMCDYLSEMARETKAHVTALHHVVGEFSDGLKPIPLSGVKGKIGRVPSLILTIHKEIDGMDSRILNVSPVKNREGFEDSSGETFSSYDFNRDNMRLTDLDSLSEF